MPAASPDIVLDVPVPVTVVPPGETVRVQVSTAGNPLSITLPVASTQVGWVIVPTTGAVGVEGWVFMTIFDDGDEVRLFASVTVYVYVPAARPEIVVDVPVPVVVDPPGDLVSVHMPVAGSPFSTTLPVARAHVGWVIEPIAGGVGGVATVRLVGANPCRKTKFVPDIVPTAVSPIVQVNEPPEKVDFSPALEIVGLLKVVCATQTEAIADKRIVNGTFILRSFI